MASRSFLSPLQPPKLAQPQAGGNPPILPTSMVGSFRNQQLGALTSGQASPQLAAPSVPAMQLSRTPTELGKSLPVSTVQASAQRTMNNIATSNRRITQYSLYDQQRKARAQESAAPSKISSNNGFVGGTQKHATADSSGMVAVGNGQFLAKNAALALGQLNQALQKATGRTISVTEGWRSLSRQKQLYALFRAGKGNLAATPGTSMHGTGRAADLGGIGSTNSTQFQWLVKNAYRFGWSWTGRTFSQVEPWHWEYVGK